MGKRLVIQGSHALILEYCLSAGPFEVNALYGNTPFPCFLPADMSRYPVKKTE
jgi:hypothetical protein